ncbi:MAG TPA: hypothetical protein VNT79_08995, partial [Phycisphaerae bacterium]|nr:hypothetical protein [Phycisphaerae bacterium]
LGHADHHCLLEVLLIASIVLIAGRSRETSRRIAFFASGCLMGLAIWTASQAAIFWLGFFVVILIAAIRVDPQRKRSSLSRAHMWATGSFLVVGLGYLLDSFDDLKTATLDRISAVHFGLLFIAAILTRAIYSASGQPRERRERPIAARWAFIGIALVCLILFFKRATYFEHMQGEVLERWHTHIAELQPMIASVPQGAGLFDATAFSLQPLHDRLGYTMYLLPLALPYFLLSRRTPGVIRAILGILAPLIAGLSVEQLRWMDHYNTFVLPVIVVGLWEVLGRVSGRLVKPVEKQLEARSASEGDPRLERDGSPANVNHPLEKWRFAISFVILAAATVPFSTYERLALVRRANSLLEGRDAALGSGPRPSLLTEQWHTADVSLRALGPREDQLRTDFVARAISLREIESPSPESRRAVLCDEGEGPALLHETGLPVVAAPYHRAIDGIVEMMQFFAERDPVLARGRLDRLGARYVVVPYRINEQLMNYEQIAFGERRSFDPPREWLDENGRLRRELQYRPELTGTMAYRLSHRPHDHGSAGVEMLYSIRDDPARPDDVHGLLFVVNDITGTP